MLSPLTPSSPLATFFTPRNHKAPINFTATGDGFNKLANNKIIQYH